MKKVIVNTLSLACLFISINCFAQEKELYTFDKKIAITGNGGYDYLALDKVNNHLFVTHGTAVNVLDLATETVIATIDSMKGVHGVAIDNINNRGFISNGKTNSLVVFDLKTFKKIKNLTLSGKGVDAVLYDPFSKRIFAFNGDSEDASVIDPKTLAQLGNVILGGSPEFAVSNGSGIIYNNIENKNSIVAIDAKTLKVINRFPIAPHGEPTALAYDKKNNRLFCGCRLSKDMIILDAKTGKKITSLPIGAGVDAIAYDEGTRFIFCSCGDGTTSIIKQNGVNTYQVLQTLKTQVKAKTLALDPNTHKIYLSVADIEENTKTQIPNTFGVLVYQ